MDVLNLTEIYGKLVDRLATWVEGAILMTPNFILAIIIVVIFSIGSRYVRKLVLNLLHRVSDNEAVNNLIATMLRLGVLAVGLFLALGVVDLDDTVTTLLAGVGVIGLALGFAFQDLAANFIAGVFMAVRKPFRIGDIIESNGFMGIVIDISLRSTVIRTLQGQKVVLPNKSVFENPLENYSTGQRRIDLGVGVSYGDDLQKAEDVTLAAVKALPMIDPNKPVDLYYEAFGDSSINFTIRFWIDFKKQTDYLKARSEAVKAIKAAYDRENITIPFPIRTLDFGIKGGQKLDAMLSERRGGA
jgi:small conductance mechanosensitive channel